MRKHTWLELESVGFGNESIEKTSFALAFVIGWILELSISSRSRVLVEVLFQFNLGIEPSLFDPKLLLFVHFLTRPGKR